MQWHILYTNDFCTNEVKVRFIVESQTLLVLLKRLQAAMRLPVSCLDIITNTRLSTLENLF
jgi:hypothetical protein